MASTEMRNLIIMMKKMMERGFGAKFDGDLDPNQLRSVIELAQGNMPLEPGVRIEKEKFGGMDAELAVPEDPREDALIIYIHGGGLVCGNAGTSRGYTSLLAAETRIPTYAFSYRLAPENPYPAAADDCILAYEEIGKKNPGKSLILIGESGGAHLSVVTALRARDRGLEPPACVIPYSVILDWSGTIDRKREDCDDFTVTAAGLKALEDMYCPDESVRRDPYCSPYFADFSGMPPMLLAWDKTETLAPDNEILVRKLQVAGVEVQYKVYEGCFHAFSTTGKGTPESYEILKDTAAFIDAHIGQQSRSGRPDGPASTESGGKHDHTG